MTNITATYPQDNTGVAASNLVGGGTQPELHTVTAAQGSNVNYIIPNAAPFFSAGLKVYAVSGTTLTLLTEGVDYFLILRYIAASYSLGVPLYGGIALINAAFSGTIGLTYQTLGGNWGTNDVAIAEQAINALYNPRTVSWDQISGVPTIFPPQPHTQPITSFLGFDALIAELEQLRLTINTVNSDPNNIAAQLAAHIASPTAHGPAQVGLGNVQNYAIATQAQAQAGIATNAYMTPYTTTQAIASGTAAAANKWAAPMTMTVGGGASGQVAFDGSGNVTLNLSILGVTWSSLQGVPIDLTAGNTLNLSRFPQLPASLLQTGTQITTGVTVSNAATGTLQPVPMSQLQNYSVGLGLQSVSIGTVPNNVSWTELSPMPGGVGGQQVSLTSSLPGFPSLNIWTSDQINTTTGQVTIPTGTIASGGAGLPVLQATMPYHALQLGQAQTMFMAASAGGALAVGNGGTGIKVWFQTLISTGTGIAWDVSQGPMAFLPLSVALDIVIPANIRPGEAYTLIVKQASTGGRLLNFASNVKWPGGVKPVLSPTANAIDIISFVSDGANLYGVMQNSFS